MRQADDEAGADAGDRTRARRLEALAQANRIRGERAAVKAALRAGEIRPGPLLLDPPDCLRTASVAEILLAVPGIGEVKLRRLLVGCRISPGSRLGRLSAPRREELVHALGPRG